MEMTAHDWDVFDAQTPLLTYLYSFGPGTAHSLAVGGEQGLIVVSPPLGVASGVFDGLARYGPVRALVASNAYHYMGIPEWKTRFPEAALFAPAQSIARVERQTKLRGFRPLADAGSISGTKVQLIDMPHYKTGEALVRIQTTRGDAWYVTDIVLNLTSLPANPLFRMMFRITNSGPGLKFNNVAPLFMVKDKAALKRWLAQELERSKPRWLIPAHGDIVDLESNREPARLLFAAP